MRCSRVSAYATVGDGRVCGWREFPDALRYVGEHDWLSVRRTRLLDVLQFLYGRVMVAAAALRTTQKCCCSCCRDTTLC